MIPLVPDAHFGPTASAYVAYAVAILLLGAAALACAYWLRYARDARRARVALDPDSELGEGAAIVVGKVQHVATSELAVRVEIDQDGSEKEDSGSWSHKWTEVDRRVKVAPFYLQREQGERIRVHPSEKVFLVDDMDGCIHFNELRRTRIVELVPGEVVIARGVLRRDLDPEGQPHGYRDAPIGWILDPPRHESLFLSSEPLETRFVRGKVFHRAAAALLLLVLVTTQLLFLPYYKMLSGETATATVISKRYYVVEDDEGDETPYWEVTALTPWGTQHTEDVKAEGWRRLEEGSRVPIRHYHQSLIQYGSRATLSWVAGLLALGIIATALITYLVAASRSKPWYMAKVVDRGDGRINPQTGLGNAK